MIGLLDWLDAPEAQRGVRVATPDSGWEFTPYTELQRDARWTAAQLLDLGVRRGDVVVLMLGRERSFAAAFAGCLLAGATPCPVSTPLTFASASGYVAHIATILRAARPAVVLTDELLHVVAGEAAAAGAVPALVAQLAAPAGEPDAVERLRRAPGELALLQFTSGSSGTPKGVRVTWRNLEHNLSALHAFVDLQGDDAVATWLPLYHDMGLVGTLLTPLTAGRDLWQLPPVEFLRAPERWLECFGVHGAAVTASPSFGFAYAARRVTEEQLAGWDFSTWRQAIVGSDRVDHAALTRFTALLAPHGFRATTFTPAYGLAESTLAVTGHPPGRPMTIVRLGDEPLRAGAPVEVRERATLGDADADPDGGWISACGRPLGGADVHVSDDDGRHLPDGHLGEIVIRSDSVADGYVGRGPFSGGRLATGDAGFLLDGELYVIGRNGDSLKVHGRNVYAEDVEAELVRIDGIRAGRCAVIFGANPDHTAVALLEGEHTGWLDEVVRLLRRVTGPSVRIRVLTAARGTIERTSSGKPRRRVIWRALEAGELLAHTLYDSTQPEAAR